MFVAHATAETVDVVNSIVGSHHKVILIKAIFTFKTFLAKQSLGMIENKLVYLNNSVEKLKFSVKGRF